LIALPAIADPIAPTRVSEFSGKPVPRFEALKYHLVNGRKGPTMDHKIMWAYERKGLPMLIIKETENWRRVRDPDGDEVWMHKRMLETSRTALTQSTITLQRSPDMTSQARATLSANLVVSIESCDAGWCKVSAQDHRGYVQETQLWGIDSRETGL